MSTVLRLRFTAGRFHATRWAENPPADPHGEWPPSPWRLLRALAAAWFETAAPGASAEVISGLLRNLAHTPPVFWLPPAARRAGPTKHYHPKGRNLPALGRDDVTLVEDHFIAIPPGEPVWWLWPDLDLADGERQLLDGLCRRVRYFGRAESLCTLEVAPGLPPDGRPNSAWQRGRFPGCRPVLCPAPDSLEHGGSPFQPEHLLERTGEMLGRGAKLPRGAVWLFYTVPEPPQSRQAPRRLSPPEGLRCLQFALGGRVWPTAEFIVPVAERLRARALKRYAVLQTGNPHARFDPRHLASERWSLTLSGKHHPDDGRARPAAGHRHAYYLPQLDEEGRITRLVVWSQTPFSPLEVEALSGVERADWGGGRYPLRVVPLPWNTPAPAFLRPDVLARVWTNRGGGTPFVPPYFSLNRSGKPMPGRSPPGQVAHLIRVGGLDVPVRCEVFDQDRPGEAASWVHVHVARATAGPGRAGPGRSDSHDDSGRGGDRRRAFWKVRLEFERGVSGPLLLGHSAHFGLGQFAPAAE